MIDTVCTIILSIFSICNAYKVVYLIIGFFCKSKKYKETDKKYNYAYVISARNEEKVIGKLIDSINGQDYDHSLMKIFVVADNCTDRTAEICREKGAIVYERFDHDHARKGYALEFLFEKIEKEYGIESVDGYFVFDADNLLAPDFTYEMNKAFATGAKIVTSYRNSKNFDTNFISAAYGIHFYHNTVSKHRPRARLNVGTHLTGTGYLFSSKLITEKGWHYTNLTEDDEFSLMASSNGDFVAFCEAAEFFDEQPTDFKTVIRQRVRWARGRIVNFVKHGNVAFKAMFKVHHFTNYDLFFHYFPYGIFTWVLGLVYPVMSFVSSIIEGQKIDVGNIFTNIGIALVSAYFYALLSGAMTVIREYKHVRCSLPKTVLYVFLYPWYTLIGTYVYLIAIFWNIKWTPILHEDGRSIDDMSKP